MPHDVLKFYFDQYVNKLINKKNITYATVLNKNIISRSTNENTLVLYDFDHSTNYIEWIVSQDGYLVSENTPLGAYDIWTYHEILPDHRYFKLEFKLKQYDNSTCELFLGLGRENSGAGLYADAGIIVKYDQIQQFTYWIRLFYSGELKQLKQLKSPTIVVKNEYLYFIGIDGDFISGNSKYEQNVFSIFIHKLNLSANLLIEQIHFTLLEEIILPFNQYEQY